MILFRVTEVLPTPVSSEIPTGGVAPAHTRLNVFCVIPDESALPSCRPITGATVELLTLLNVLPTMIRLSIPPEEILAVPFAYTPTLDDVTRLFCMVLSSLSAPADPVVAPETEIP